MLNNMSYIVLDEETMKAYRCLTSQDLMDVITKLEAPRKKRNLFRKLIQYPKPERLLERLHELIDGENGAAVGSVLLKCMQLGYLKKTPTQAEYVSEFQLIGTWSAIHNYMDDNSWKALSRANKVIIFED